MLFLADNVMMVQENDRAVQQILQSTLQLNQLFKDVAQLVSEQVTALHHSSTIGLIFCKK